MSSQGLKFSMVWPVKCRNSKRYTNKQQNGPRNTGCIAHSCFAAALNCLKVEFSCIAAVDGQIWPDYIQYVGEKQRSRRQLTGFVVSEGMRKTILLWLVRLFFSLFNPHSICRADGVFVSTALLCIYVVTQIHTWDLLSTTKAFLKGPSTLTVEEEHNPLRICKWTLCRLFRFCSENTISSLCFLLGL